MLRQERRGAGSRSFTRAARTGLPQASQGQSAAIVATDSRSRQKQGGPPPKEKAVRAAFQTSRRQDRLGGVVTAAATRFATLTPRARSRAATCHRATLQTSRAEAIRRSSTR